MVQAGALCFKADAQVEFFEGLTGKRPDAAIRRLAGAGLQAQCVRLIDKGFDGRRAGEQHRIGAFLTKARRGWVRTQIGLAGLVKWQCVDNCTAFGFEALNQAGTVLIAGDNQYLQALSNHKMIGSPLKATK